MGEPEPASRKWGNDASEPPPQKILEEIMDETQKEKLATELAAELLVALEMLCNACDLFITDIEISTAISPAYESARALIAKIHKR
jgi:hypothetical protein